MKTRMTIGLVAVLALLFGACGGSSGDDLDAYADALAAGVQADDSDGSVEVSDDEADCIGSAAAKVIGLDALKEIGTPDEVTEASTEDLSAFSLSDGAALDIATQYVGCIPNIVEQFADMVSEGDDDVAECLNEDIDTDMLVPSFQAVIQTGEQSDETIDEALVEVITACFVTAGDLPVDETDDTDDTDDTSDAGFDDYAAALAAQIIATDGVEVGITDTQADCIAEEMLNTIGEERVTAIGSPDEFVAATQQNLAVLDLEPGELRTIAQGYLTCSPESAVGFREIFTESAGATGTQATCINDLLTEELIVEILTETFGGGDGSVVLGEYEAQFAACA